jgi:PAS domain S-box-containing protein
VAKSGEKVDQIQEDQTNVKLSHYNELINQLTYISQRKSDEEFSHEKESVLTAIFKQAPLGIALIDSLTGRFYEVNARFTEIAGRTIQDMQSIDWMSITHPDELHSASLYARSLLEASLDPLVTISKEGKLTDVNEAAVQATGVAREDLIGSDFSEYFTEPGKARASYREVFAKGFVTDYALSLRHVSGSVMHVLYNASLYYNKNGAVAGVFAAARDVTERKKAEIEILKLNSELEKRVEERTTKLAGANKELKSFAYSVSHDLRVPLRAIDGFSQQILKKYKDRLDEEGQRFLTIVRDNTKKMSQLIDDILAFSRMGHLELTASDINMEEMVQNVFDEILPQITGRELTVKIGHLPHCHGDPAMFRQLWVNLLGNAVKFTENKSKAEIEVGVKTEGTEQVYFIKDNGAGFDMKYADKLFGVFQRLPKVDGLEVLRRLKEDEISKKIPIVVLSSSKEDRDVIASYNLGVNSYISKPVDFDDFTKVVSDLGMYWLMINRPPVKG